MSSQLNPNKQRTIPPVGDFLLNQGQAAEVLGRSRVWVNQKIKEGLIKTVKLGSIPMVHSDELRRIMRDGI